MAETEEKKEKKEPKGITLSMSQLIGLSFGLCAVFLVIAAYSWLSGFSTAVAFNSAAIAAIACYVGIRAVLYSRKQKTG